MEGLSNMPMPKKKFISEHFQPYANMSASINGLSVLKKKHHQEKKVWHQCSPSMHHVIYFLRKKLIQDLLTQDQDKVKTK
jgi:hypothetical protein